MSSDDLERLVATLDKVAEAGFPMDKNWEAAHELCQSHEGNSLFDWGHAICHRIEGDQGNAAYWYRRAGKSPADGALAEEWKVARVVMLAAA
ncbi:MAG: hypothetical protein CML29_16500 [Rhizobiales bacterium]|nr:hypothetical protein [Hyphomicrobiales bacterium]MBA67621.1 hypothetical protein [Hyphomicrobiales bacterium]|tara:strand:- start:313 stop:588 length:276 start_codon:yes stop_codon:yes gene_type:complete